MKDITNVIIGKNGTGTAESVYQYSYGITLRIGNVQLPTAVEVQFSLHDTRGESIPRIGLTRDGVTDVIVPDSMLENGDVAEDYNIFAWVYVRGEKTGTTEYKIVIPVLARAKPAPHDTPEEAELFKKAINAVNEAADRAETAGTAAQSWAIGGTGTRDNEDADNARYYAQSAAQSATTATEKEQAVSNAEAAASELYDKVKELSAETSENAENAAQSATAAGNSAAVASTSQQAAIEAAGRAARSESAAAESEKTATSAAIAAEKSAAAASSAQQRSEAAQAAAAKSAEAAATSEQNASSSETASAQSAKAAAESEKAAGASAAAASASEQAATTAAQQTAADRQATETASAAAQQSAEAATSAQQSIQASADQIETNKTGIESLKEDFAAETATRKEDVEKLSQSKISKFYASNQGETHLADSDNGKIQDMMLYGKSSQDGTPSPENPVEIKSVVNPTIKVTNKDGLKVHSVTLNITLNAISVSSGGNVTIDGKQYIADYVDVERGKYVQMIQTDKVQSNITWTIQKQQKGYSLGYAALCKNGIPTNTPRMGNTWKSNVGDSSDMWSNAFSFGRSAVFWIVPYENDGNLTSDDINAWLVEHPMDIMYPLTKPIETDLTSEENEAFKALVTNHPVTNISVTSDQLDGYTVFNYPISMQNGWNYVKKQLNDNRDYIYDMDLQSAEAYVNSEYAVALTELEV